MKKITEKDRFISILNREEVDRVSIACPLQTGTIEMMEATNVFWPEAHYSPEMMAELSYAAHKLAGIESVRVPFCLTVEAEILGCKIGNGGKKSQPSVLESALTTIDEFNSLSVPDPTKDGRMPTVAKSLRILKDKVGDTVPLIAGVVSPFTLAGHIRGIDNLLLDFFDNPEDVVNLINFCCEVCISYSQYLGDNGADCISLVEPSATSEVIGPKYFQEYASPYIKKVIKNLEVPTILHICGNTVPILSFMGDTGVNGISIDHVVDISEAKDKIRKTALIGNINPVDPLLFGPVDQIVEQSLLCVEKGVDILAPGCGLSPATPIENIRAMTSLAKRYS